jgi:GR25 family glycosyltransferase involved in LPS biosynthesis
LKNHSGWQPELRPGYVAGDVPVEQVKLDGHLARYTGVKQLTKLACFWNHVRFWQEVTDADQGAVFLEHDVMCVADATGFHHDFEHLFHDSGKHHTYRNQGIKISEIYRGTNQYSGATTMAGQGGTAAYYVSPAGAQQLLEAYYKWGAEQSDLFINSYNIDIHTHDPSLFELDLTSISTSHGINC